MTELAPQTEALGRIIGNRGSEPPLKMTDIIKKPRAWPGSPVVRAASTYAKAVGPTPGPGSYNNQPTNAWIKG